MDKEVTALEEELVHITWFMRGGITLNEAYAMTPSHREIVGKLIKKNLEVTKESGLPFF